VDGFGVGVELAAVGAAELRMGVLPVGFAAWEGAPAPGTAGAAPTTML
jgi:hypothetical protein